MRWHTSYMAHVSRNSVDGTVRWSITRTRWAFGQATLSAVVAEGTFPDLSVPPGTPLCQAATIYGEVAAALTVMQAEADGELDAHA